MAVKTGLAAWFGIALAAAVPQGLEAQEESRSRFEGVSKGAGIDRFIYEGTGETAFSYRVSGLRPGRLGPEFSVSFFPRALAAQALLFAPDFGGAYNVSIPNATLLIKGGASALTGVATDVLFIAGVHLGAGLMVRLDAQTGFRLDVARHFYFENGETEPIWSVGVGFCSLPRLR